MLSLLSLCTRYVLFDGGMWSLMQVPPEPRTLCLCPLFCCVCSSPPQGAHAHIPHKNPLHRKPSDGLRTKPHGFQASNFVLHLIVYL